VSGRRGPLGGAPRGPLGGAPRAGTGGAPLAEDFLLSSGKALP